MTITAARKLTSVRARIHVRQVAVIAWLLPLIDDPIAAASEGARVGARVRVRLVTIVAGFLFVHDPVAAAFASARARAAVLIGGVAVVTVFSKVHDAVAAALDRALLVAAVARHEVPIIAALKTALVRLQVDAYDPVATARRDATLGAGVVVGVVPVVTVLAVVNACVATALKDARVVTGIGRIRVTVITFLVSVDRPITAKGSRYDRVTAAARYHHSQRNPHHTTLHDLPPETARSPRPFARDPRLYFAPEAGFAARDSRSR